MSTFLKSKTANTRGSFFTRIPVSGNNLLCEVSWFMDEDEEVDISSIRHGKSAVNRSGINWKDWRILEEEARQNATEKAERLANEPVEPCL